MTTTNKIQTISKINGDEDSRGDEKQDGKLLIQFLSFVMTRKNGRSGISLNFFSFLCIENDENLKSNFHPLFCCLPACLLAFLSSHLLKHP
jgi:hypothetical protein